MMTVLCFGALAQTQLITNAEFSKKAEAYMQALVSANGFSGNVLVMRKNQPIYQANFGFANEAFDVPIAENTVFRLGSITKSFTAVAIMQLIRDGKLSLDQSIASFYPDFEHASKIRIRHLLSHGSGLPTDIDTLENKSYTPYSKKEIREAILAVDLNFEPGTQFQYSNIAYYLLGDIIEKASGEDYSSFLKKRIFDPLGMTQTEVDFPQKRIKNRAVGYSTGTWNESQEFTQLTIAPQIHTPNDLGNGGLLSSQTDLYKFDRALYGERLLNEEEKQLMFSTQNGRYGLGWWLGSSLPVQFHSGNISGFTSSLIRSPEHDVCIVVLSNYEDADGQGTALTLTRMLFGQDYYLPQARMQIELDVTTLPQLEAKYNTSQFWFTLHLTNGRLWVVTPGDPYEELVPGENNQFFSKLHDFSVNFDDKTYQNGYVQFQDQQWRFTREDD